MKNFFKNNPPAVTAVCFVLFMAGHMFVGNPVSKIIAGTTLDKYIEEKYPGCYYEDYSYDFTSNGYTAVVYSHSNPDVRIVVHTDTFGFTVTKDNYEDAVALGENTSRRLNNEYTEVLKDIVGEEICGYKIYRLFGSFADNEVTGEQYSLKSGPLVPGAEYDIYEISPTDGDIFLRVIAPGATDDTAEEILQTVRQQLEDNGIIFDTISLSIGEDADCWPYIISINKIPYSIFSQPDFSEIIQGVHLYNNPQWSLAFNRIADRYNRVVQSVDWQRTENFEITDIQADLNIYYDLAETAYGNIMYRSVNGIDVGDIDVINYEAYTDREIARFGNKAGHITFYVTAQSSDFRVAADIINEINVILKNNGLEYLQADLAITTENQSTPRYYRNLSYKEEPWKEKEISRHW